MKEWDIDSVEKERHREIDNPIHARNWRSMRTEGNRKFEGVFGKR